ncbi:hypothetical protein RIF29_15237 [Crotalaria pallida]|uniref:Uncharacterized protein n=1 Tax=Crotalaria pallida TaxID=3830 RepID=A0AAN9FEJ7_CROPI
MPARSVPTISFVPSTAASVLRSVIFSPFTSEDVIVFAEKCFPSNVPIRNCLAALGIGVFQRPTLSLFLPHFLFLLRRLSLLFASSTSGQPYHTLPS